MWKAQLVSVKNSELLVRYYNGIDESVRAYPFDGTETKDELFAPIIAEVARLNTVQTKSTQMETTLSAYLGKDIA